MKEWGMISEDTRFLFEVMKMVANIFEYSNIHSIVQFIYLFFGCTRS